MANSGSTINFAGGGTVVWEDIKEKPEYYPTQWGDIADVPPETPPDWSEITSKPTTFPAVWDEVTSKPSAYPTTWSNVSSKPTTFAPAEHANEAHNPDYRDTTTPITTVIPHTWVVPNAVTVPSGTTDAIPPMIITVPTGKTAKLLSMQYRLLGGTSATFSLQRNGSNIIGFTNIVVGTGTAITNPTDITLAESDRIQPVITAVSGSPVGLSISIVIEYGG